MQDGLSRSNILAELADWIETYMEQTGRFREHWFEMYLDEEEFWNTFTLVPEAMLKRGFV